MKSNLTCFSPLKVFLGLSLCLLLAQGLRGQTKGMRIALTPDWVKPLDYSAGDTPAADQISGGAYLECYEQQYNLDKGAVYSHVVRKLITETGVQNNAQFAISFDPAYQHILFHQICLIRSGHVINQLDLSKIRLIKNEQDLERFMYSGLYTAYFNFEDVRTGDKVAFAYTLVGRNPILDHHFGQELYFSSQNFIHHLFFRITTAADQDLHLRYFNDAAKAQIAHQGKRTIYEWALNNIPADLPESSTPFWYNGGPHVQISTFDNWTQVVDWAQANVAVPAAKKTAALSKLSDELESKAGADTLKYITAATDFVQDKIRYMGIEMGMHSHLPHPPGKVLQQRYGDCKDKSLLLITLLQRKGIAARMALVNSYNGQQLRQYLPAIFHFNHAIVTFTYAGKRYWIDPTISVQGGDITNIATPDYGYALVVDGKEKGLRRMNIQSDSKTDILETFIVPANNEKDGLLEVISTYTGAEADQMRQQLRYSSRKEVQKSYMEYYNGLYMHISLADSLTIADDPVVNTIKLRELYHLADPWTVVDSSNKRRRFSVYARPVSNRLPAVVNDNRRSPVALSNNINLQYHLQLILPDEGWSIQPQVEDINRKAYHFEFASEQIDDTVKLDYSFHTFQNYISADSADLLNGDLRKIDGDLTYQLTVNNAILTNSSTLSWVSVLIAVLCLGVFSYFGIRMYRYSPDRLDGTFKEGLPIGGWLILVAIGLCFNPLKLIFLLVNGQYFSRAIWINAKALSSELIFFIGFELIAILFLLATVVLAIFLFFRRRTTFPSVFIFICIVNLIITLTDVFVTLFYVPGSPNQSGQVFGAVVYSAIWIPYMLISKRVKATFVYPYSSKDQITTADISGMESIPAESEQSGPEV